MVHHPTEPESQRRTRTSRLFARVTIDLSPLRTSRDYRLLFTGSMVSFIGSMVTYITVPFQVKELTGSLVAVGLLGAAELVPLVLFGLYGGALADVVDRRRMVLLSEGLGPVPRLLAPRSSRLAALHVRGVAHDAGPHRPRAPSLPRPSTWHSQQPRLVARCRCRWAERSAVASPTTLPSLLHAPRCPLRRRTGRSA